ncbi:hypothetical protein FAD87_RS15070 [Enterococcus hirae]|uniref:hypothetical protein n=1 Tax=Enterococcus TaxID=1350 RepID=UPI0019F1087B|nr:hypothetical protein [Enterococcus hirae]EMF0105851.1 hypothetical protein [Enterococcus hirae]EMF0131670.1 hypothetical protein [Enterococcus hirae]EMF0283392.1 hypothetical protein [Enterococcus hirae]MCA6767097.1 hypothetical protein [Enterococcus hirae]
MNKRIYRIVGLFFLLVIVFSGCGNKEKRLENILTSGDGTWNYIKNNGQGKLIFFDDGTVKVIDRRQEFDATYTINKEGTELKMNDKDSELYTEIKNIKIENDKTIKGDLYQSGQSETILVNLVK